jgi:hypothetical protein
LNVKEEKMKVLAFLIIASLLAAFYSPGILTAKDYEVAKKVGEYSIIIKIDKNPPVAGKNNVEISVADATGRAVTDAKVVVELSMAPMPGMPAANYKSNTELKGDRYKVVVEPSMAGPWNLAVKVTRGGKTDTAKLTLDVK